MANYFDACVELSRKHLPPGVNATNWNWIQEVAKVSTQYMSPPSDVVQKSRADDVYRVFEDFARFTNRTFTDGGSYEGSTTDFIKINKESIAYAAIAVGSAIVIVAGGGAGAQRWLASSLAGFCESLNNDNVSKGRHANGWIDGMFKGDAVRGALKNTKDLIDEKGSADDDARRVGAVLKSVMGQFLAISTPDHKPWLRGEWQIQFTAISLAAAEGFRQLIGEGRAGD